MGAWQELMPTQDVPSLACPQIPAAGPQAMAVPLLWEAGLCLLGGCPQFGVLLATLLLLTR